MELLTPVFSLDKVEDITPEFLAENNISALLIDVDNTLVSRATGAFESPVLDWIETMKQAGISLCLLSNNWHQVTHDHAATAGLPLVAKAMKPAPIAYIRALNTIGAKRETTAMVGDQLFTDILGARLCVMPCILVRPLSSVDLWYTRIFRKFEDFLTSS